MSVTLRTILASFNQLVVLANNSTPEQNTLFEILFVCWVMAANCVKFVLISSNTNTQLDTNTQTTIQQLDKVITAAMHAMRGDFTNIALRIRSVDIVWKTVLHGITL